MKKTPKKKEIVDAPLSFRVPLSLRTDFNKACTKNGAKQATIIQMLMKLYVDRYADSKYMTIKLK